jgi:hypothetical protein
MSDFSNLDQKTPNSKNEQPPTSLLGLLLTLFWAAFGVVALLFFAYSIAFRKSDPFFSYFFFWLDAFALIGARYVDIRFFNGQTTDSAPATMEHWKRYSRNVALGATPLFLLAFLYSRLFV